MTDRYIPDRGDLVWLDFSPQQGHEQRGKRPAIVLSPQEYNAKSGLALFCPITSTEKGYPFEVKVQKTNTITGVILADQVKSLDWRARAVSYVESVTRNVVKETLMKIRALL